MSLEIRNLKIAFKQQNSIFEAIHGVNFKIEQGKALGIVGESGCGKTLSAMSIMRLLPSNAFVSDGEIIYNGVNLLALKDDEMRSIRGNKIALIPQDPLTSLNPLYTIGDQLMEVILLHQKVSPKEAQEIALNALEMVRIPDAAKRFDAYPYQFSGGMCQRVIIAMALSSQPEFLIADEPTTALDVTVQAQIMDLFAEIREKTPNIAHSD
jgi:peptide/nickel transport system ATP-binding protein/oligopeptide transport system ATP-binding protein